MMMITKISMITIITNPTVILLIFELLIQMTTPFELLNRMLIILTSIIT